MQIDDVGAAEMEDGAGITNLVDDDIIAHLRGSQGLDVGHTQRLSFLHAHVGLGRLGTEGRRLLLVDRIADEAPGQRSRRRAKQCVGAGVVGTADGRAGQGARRPADQGAGCRIIRLAVRDVDNPSIRPSQPLWSKTTLSI